MTSHVVSHVVSHMTITNKNLKYKELLVFVIMEPLRTKKNVLENGGSVWKFLLVIFAT